MELSNFNKIYVNLLEDLNNGYPDYEINININEIKKNEYLDHFMTNILPKMDNISSKNYDYFRYKCSNDELVKDFKFKYLFVENDRENISIIWKYMQKLYVQMYSIESIFKYVEKFKSHKNFGLMMISLDKNNYNTYLDNFLKIKNRIKKKGKKKKKKKRSKEKKQVFKDPVLSSEEEDNGGMFPNLDNLDSSFIENSTIGKLAKEISSEIDSSQFENMENPADLLGSLFGGGSDKEDNDGAKESFGNLMKTVCSKLDNKFKSGDIKQDDLFKEAQEMMGGLNLFDPNMLSKMMQGGMPGMPGMPGGQDMRARKMKRKLNKKFKERNNNN